MSDDDEDVTPDWLKQLIEGLLPNIETESLIGYSSCDSETWECWMLEVYPGLVRNSEGREVFGTRFIVDVTSIVELFDALPAMTATSEALMLDGAFAGNDVVVRLLWAPPDDVEPVAEVHTDGSLSELVEEDPGPVRN